MAVTCKLRYTEDSGRQTAEPHQLLSVVHLYAPPPGLTCQNYITQIHDSCANQDDVRYAYPLHRMHDKELNHVGKDCIY